MFDQLKRALGKVIWSNEGDLVENAFRALAAEDRSLPRSISARLLKAAYVLRLHEQCQTSAGCID